MITEHYGFNIEIIYTDKYPNACSGNLIVVIHDDKHDFGTNCGVTNKFDFGIRALLSGGSVSFTKDGDEHVTSGEWSINDDAWPSELPVLPVLRMAILDAVNEQVPHGCCGGCV